MRHFILLIAALATLASPAGAAQQCQSTADQSASEVLALRELMTVLVFKCNREKDYNDNFIKRFQPVLQANDREVLSYFRKVYGGAAQGRKDTYTTELVNVLSQQANTHGAEFCGRTALMVNEMLALPRQDDLAAYAATKDIAPVGVSMCVAQRAATPARRRR